jgi:hypothetical protein
MNVLLPKVRPVGQRSLVLRTRLNNYHPPVTLDFGVTKYGRVPSGLQPGLDVPSGRFFSELPTDQRLLGDGTVTEIADLAQHGTMAGCNGVTTVTPGLC